MNLRFTYVDEDVDSKKVRIRKYRIVITMLQLLLPHHSSARSIHQKDRVIFRNYECNSRNQTKIVFTISEFMEVMTG